MALAHGDGIGRPDRFLWPWSEGVDGRRDALAGLFSVVLHATVAALILTLPEGTPLPAPPPPVIVDLVLEPAAPESPPDSEDPPAPPESVPAPEPPPVAAAPPPEAPADTPAEPPPPPPATIEPVPETPPPPPALEPATARIAPPPPPRKPRMAPSAPRPQVAAPAAPATAPAAPAETPRPAPDPSPASPSATADYAAAVNGRLERFKTYPRQARLQRQEGVVMVRFLVTADGRVTSCTVAASSGYTLLDEEACALVHRAAPLPPPGAGRRDPLELALPVRFSLP